MRYLGEFYQPDHKADLGDLAAQPKDAAAAASKTGPAVHFVHVIHAPGDESCFALYEADSMAAAEAAGSLAGITFDRIVEVATRDAD
jgi:hypothetical protein